MNDEMITSHDPTGLAGAAMSVRELFSHVRKQRGWFPPPRAMPGKPGTEHRIRAQVTDIANNNSNTSLLHIRLQLLPSPSPQPLDISQSRRGDFALRAFGRHGTPACSPWGWVGTDHLKLQTANLLPSDAFSTLSEKGGRETESKVYQPNGSTHPNITRFVWAAAYR